MTRRVEVFIKNILPAHSHGAYTLVLHNPSSKIQLPVLIGSIEAQSIAMEMENIQSSRPLTHDLFVSALKKFEIGVKEICVEKLEEGIYYSTIYFIKDGIEHAMDSRTSDAIALAMKYKSPIFVLQEIIDEAGYHEEDISEEEEMDETENDVESFFSKLNVEDEPSDDEFADLSTEDLNRLLQEAIIEEDYDRAASIRDELAKRKS
jgi:bifunctional DNase/RNase